MGNPSEPPLISIFTSASNICFYGMERCITTSSINCILSQIQQLGVKKSNKTEAEKKAPSEGGSH